MKRIIFMLGIIGIFMFSPLYIVKTSADTRNGELQRLSFPANQNIINNPEGLKKLQSAVVKIKAIYAHKEKPANKVTRNGSGVFVDTQGSVLAILTNEHIIKMDNELEQYRLEKVIVETFNGAVAEGSTVWRDKELDLVLVHTPFTNTSAARISKQKPALGNDIIIIGHPFTFAFWHISFCKVSFVDRPTEMIKLIEVDGHINPGNSGGAAFNTKGELVGVPKSAISSMNEFFSQTGIGFFIPIEYFCNAQPLYCPEE